MDFEEKITVKDFFGMREEVFAEWFSGEIRIPTGPRLQYVHMGYASTYEKDILLEFIEGVLVSERIVDNKESFNKKMKKERAEEERMIEKEHQRKSWSNRLRRLYYNIFK